MMYLPISDAKNNATNVKRWQDTNHKTWDLDVN